MKTIKLTREDVLKKSMKRPLGQLRWQDLRGNMRDFAEADIVLVYENRMVKIMKDRQGIYQVLPRDKSGCVSESDIDDIKLWRRPGTKRAQA